MKPWMKSTLCLLLLLICLPIILNLAACQAKATQPDLPSSQPAADTPAAEPTPTPGPPSPAPADSQTAGLDEKPDDPVVTRAQVVGRDGDQLAVLLEGDTEFTLTSLPEGGEDITPGMAVDIRHDPWVNDIWPSTLNSYEITPVEDDGGLLQFYLDTLEHLHRSAPLNFDSPDEWYMPTYGFDFSGLDGAETQALQAMASWFAWKNGAHAAFGTRAAQDETEGIARVECLYSLSDFKNSGQALEAYAQWLTLDHTSSFTAAATLQEGRWAFQKPQEITGTIACWAEIPEDSRVPLRRAE